MAERVTHIVMAEALPESGAGCYAHFHHKTTAQTSWTCCDVRAVIGRHQDAWLEQIDAWHGELSRRAAARTPWWWLLPGSRMTVWAPVDFKPLLFALGVIEVCEAERPARLYLLECPDEVAEYVEEWSRQSAGAVVLTREGREHQLDAPRGQMRRIVGALRAMGALVVRMARRGPVSPLTRSADVIVFSWTLSALSLEQEGDHFFGRSLDDPNGPLAGRVAWLYALSQANERQRIRGYCESIGRQIAFGFELLRWRDVPAILGDCIRLTWALRTVGQDIPELRVGLLRTSGFGRRCWETAVAWQWPVDEFAMRRVMTRCIAAVKATSVIYPYEEKGIERSIITACESCHPPVSAVAFAHAAFNLGHRYVRRTPPTDRPTPHALATTGPAAGDWLVATAAVPRAEIAFIGSPRWAPPGGSPRISGGRRVLFLVGYGSEIGLLVRFVEQQRNLFDGFDLVIRRYPHSWEDEQDRWLAELRDREIPFRIDAGAIHRQIADADIVIFNSTSAGIESMLQGRATIHVALHDVVDVDPFQGQKAHPAVLSCATPLALRHTLLRLAALDAQQYESLAQAQRAFATTIFAPFDTRAFARVMALPVSPDNAGLAEIALRAGRAAVRGHAAVRSVAL